MYKKHPGKKNILNRGLNGGASKISLPVFK